MLQAKVHVAVLTDFLAIIRKLSIHRRKFFEIVKRNKERISTCLQVVATMSFHLPPTTCFHFHNKKHRKDLF